MNISELVNGGYEISIYLLLLSTIISRLELNKVPRHYLGFIYPRIEGLEANTFKWRVLHLVQILLCILVALCFYFDNLLLFKLFFASTAILSLLVYKLRTISKDGADQIRILTFLSFSLCFLLEDSLGRMISIGFMGLQVLLGYTTSGIAKLNSPYWRKGNVLHQIFGTYSYGNHRLAEFLKDHPKVERFVAYSAIAMMLAVPVSFFIPSPYAIGLSLLGIFSFHFGTAAIMGLNDFLITFPIAYPGIILLHGWLHHYLAP